MDDLKNTLLQEFQELVQIGEPVQSDQINLYGKWTEISDKSYKLRTLINAWEKQHTEERGMRKKFAIAILFALFLQIIAINTAFFFIGFNIISVPRWVATTFIVSVFTEIISMTLLVLRYLFPKLGTEVMGLIKNL